MFSTGVPGHPGIPPFSFQGQGPVFAFPSQGADISPFGIFRSSSFAFPPLSSALLTPYLATFFSLLCTPRNQTKSFNTSRHGNPRTPRTIRIRNRAGALSFFTSQRYAWQIPHFSVVPSLSSLSASTLCPGPGWYPPSSDVHTVLLGQLYHFLRLIK